MYKFRGIYTHDFETDTRTLIDNDEEGVIIRIADNAIIPFAENNMDYREYLAWVAEGNTAESADE